MADITKEFATVSPGSGVGDYTCQVTCQQNPSVVSRQVQFTVRTASGVEKILIVTQEGKQIIPLDVDYTVNYTKNGETDYDGIWKLQIEFLTEDPHLQFTTDNMTTDSSGTETVQGTWHKDLDADTYYHTTCRGLRYSMIPQQSSVPDPSKYTFRIMGTIKVNGEEWDNLGRTWHGTDQSVDDLFMSEIEFGDINNIELVLNMTYSMESSTSPYHVETSGTFALNPGVSASDRPTLSALFEGMGDNEQVVWSKKIALPEEGGTIPLRGDELEIDNDFLGTNFAGLRVTLTPQEGFTRQASYLANPIQVRIKGQIVASKGNQVISLNTPVTIPVVNAYTWAAGDTMSVTMSLTEQSVQPNVINIIVHRGGQYIPDSDLDSGGLWNMYIRLKTDSGEIPDSSSDGLLIGTLNNDMVGGGSLIGSPFQLEISRNFEGAMLHSIEVRIVPTDMEPQPIGDPSAYSFHVECDVTSNASGAGQQLLTSDIQGNSSQDLTMENSIMVNDGLSLNLSFDVTYSNR